MEGVPDKSGDKFSFCRPPFRYICRMKRLITTLTLLAATLCAAAQEATLPTPDAKTLGMAASP